MNTISRPDMFFSEITEYVDEKIIEKLSIEAMNINPYNDSWCLYNKFYMSKYTITDISKQETELKNHIRNLTNKYSDKIKTPNKSNKKLMKNDNKLYALKKRLSHLQ